MKFTEEELERIKKERMEEIDRWLDNEYGCSYTRLEELHDFLIDRNMKFQDELQRYKNIVEETQIELFDIKDMIYKPETREQNMSIQRKISEIIKKLEELKGE